MSDQYTELDRLTILSLLEQGEHGAAYQPVANELTPGTSLHTWFTNAALINANAGSASVFARVQTYGAY